RLAASAEVVRDKGEFNAAFPEFYIGEVVLTLTDGRTLSATSRVARGYPEQPLSQNELDQKFDEVTSAVCSAQRRKALAKAAASLYTSTDVSGLTKLLG